MWIAIHDDDHQSRVVRNFQFPKGHRSDEPDPRIRQRGDMTNYFDSNHFALSELSGLAGLAGAGLLYDHTLQAQRRRIASYPRFELRFPYGVEGDGALHFLTDLLAGLPRVAAVRTFDVAIVDVIASEGRIQHFLELPQARVEQARSNLYASVPGARLLEVEKASLSLPSAVVELALTNPYLPLRVDTAAATNRSILAAMQPLRREERLQLSWILSSVEPQGGVHRALGLVAPSRGQSLNQMTPEEKRKHAAPMVGVVGRVGAWAADEPRARQLVGRVHAAMLSVAVPGARIVVRPISLNRATRRLLRRDIPAVAFPLILNAREMLGVIGWPLESPSLPGLVLMRGRPLPPDGQLPWSGRPLGISTFPGRERWIYAPFDSLTRNTWLVGPTGSGKSWLMVQLALADIARRGMGVVVIDFKSDTVDDILARFDPVRDRDLVILDVISDRPLGLNPLAGAHRNPEVRADHLFAIFKRLWHLEGLAQTSDLLHACLLTLAQTPGATLTDFGPLLTNPGFRNELTRQFRDDPILGGFWSGFAARSESDRATIVAPLLTRVRQILLRSDLRVMLGQAKSAIDFAEILNSGKVLLVPLSAGLIGPESATLLASFVLSGVWGAAQGRAALPPEHRRPASVIVDEWQLAAAGVTDMAEVLSLSRGFGVGWTLANQSPAQLPTHLREAVATNTRTKLAFACASGDAAALAREFEDVTPADLQGLGRFHAMANVALADGAVRPVTLATQPLDRGFRSPAELRRQSSVRYGRPRDEVEAEIRSRHLRAEGEVGDTPGMRRRQP
jgi:hypothetical protein